MMVNGAFTASVRAVLSSARRVLCSQKKWRPRGTGAEVYPMISPQKSSLVQATRHADLAMLQMLVNLGDLLATIERCAFGRTCRF
ncbi:hypothetical protein B0E50_07585 [Rhodanobacter sp. C01]|nr:hypothetical protein B0E50_07585 [Rhodanobacter sp. C01]